MTHLGSAIWPTTKVGRLFQVLGGTTPSSDEDNWNGSVAWVTPVDLRPVHGGWVSESNRTLSETGAASAGLTPAPEGSIVVSCRAPVGYVAINTVPVTTNQGCKTLVATTDVDARYFRYQLEAFRDVLEARGRGATFDEVSSQTVAHFPVVSPPLDMQRRIADMLDAETTRIDAVIEKNELAQRLLDVRERSLINQAVTSQLPLNLLAKATQDAAITRGSPQGGYVGVGNSEAAAQWPTTPTRFVLTEVDERGPREGEEGTLLSVSEYHGVVPRSESASQQAASEDLSHYKRCEPGQLVLNKLWAFRGGIGVSPYTGLVSPDYAVFEIHPRMEPRFVHYQTRSAWFVAEMTKRLRGIGNPDASLGRAPRLNTSELGRIDMYTPSLEVQQSVADMIDTEKSKMHSLQSAVHRQQELLRLRRQALVTAAVTGQIEV